MLHARVLYLYLFIHVISLADKEEVAALLVREAWRKASAGEEVVAVRAMWRGGEDVASQGLASAVAIGWLPRLK